MHPRSENTKSENTRSEPEEKKNLSDSKKSELLKISDSGGNRRKNAASIADANQTFILSQVSKKTDITELIGAKSKEITTSSGTFNDIKTISASDEIFSIKDRKELKEPFIAPEVLSRLCAVSDGANDLINFSSFNIIREAFYTQKLILKELISKQKNKIIEMSLNEFNVILQKLLTRQRSESRNIYNNVAKFSTKDDAIKEMAANHLSFSILSYLEECIINITQVDKDEKTMFNPGFNPESLTQKLKDTRATLNALNRLSINFVKFYINCRRNGELVDSYLKKQSSATFTLQGQFSILISILKKHKFQNSRDVLNNLIKLEDEVGLNALSLLTSLEQSELSNRRIISLIDVALNSKRLDLTSSGKLELLTAKMKAVKSLMVPIDIVGLDKRIAYVDHLMAAQKNSLKHIRTVTLESVKNLTKKLHECTDEIIQLNAELSNIDQQEMEALENLDAMKTRKKELRATISANEMNRAEFHEMTNKYRQLLNTLKKWEKEINDPDSMGALKAAEEEYYYNKCEITTFADKIGYDKLKEIVVYCFNQKQLDKEYKTKNNLPHFQGDFYLVIDVQEKLDSLLLSSYKKPNQTNVAFHSSSSSQQSTASTLLISNTLVSTNDHSRKKSAPKIPTLKFTKQAGSYSSSSSEGRPITPRSSQDKSKVSEAKDQPCNSKQRSSSIKEKSAPPVKLKFIKSGSMTSLPTPKGSTSSLESLSTKLDGEKSAYTPPSLRSLKSTSSSSIAVRSEQDELLRGLSLSGESQDQSGSISTVSAMESKTPKRRSFTSRKKKPAETQTVPIIPLFELTKASSSPNTSSHENGSSAKSPRREAVVSWAATFTQEKNKEKNELPSGDPNKTKAPLLKW